MEDPKPNQSLIIIGNPDKDEPWISLIRQSFSGFKNHVTAMEVRDRNSLESLSRPPWLLICQWKPETEKLMDWIRRHPILHSTPVVLSGNPDDRRLITADNQYSTFAMVFTPIEKKDWATVFQKRANYPVTLEQMVRLDSTFFKTVEKRILPFTKKNADSDLKSFLTSLHTLKGEALSLNWNTLSNLIHRLEPCVSHIRERPESPLSSDFSKCFSLFNDYFLKQIDRAKTGKLIDSIPEDLDRLLSRLEKNTAQSKTSKTETTANTPDLELEETFSLSLRRFDELQRVLKKTMRDTVQMGAHIRDYLEENPEHPLAGQLKTQLDSIGDDQLSLVQILLEIFSVPQRQIREFFKTVIKQTASHLKKEVDWELDLEKSIIFDQAVFESLKFILIHFVRNSIDHGIESSSERVKMGKSEKGKIRLKIRQGRRHRFHLIFEDDGRGIQKSRLKEVAKKSGLKSVPENELNQLIFEENFSTSGKTSNISGRGIGLSGVKNLVEERGGKIKVETTEGRGTRFEIELPRVIKLP